MTTFTTKDANLMNWEEFSQITDDLISKINTYFEDKEKINVITPLLRTGGIIGGILSIKMKVFTMLPVQFKYSYNPKAVNQVISIPDILINISQPMNILLCEGNTSTGALAMKAVTSVKEKYPEAKIYLATLTKIHDGPKRLEGIEEIFYGRLTDEKLTATEEERVKYNLLTGITIFPWENADE